MTKTLGHENALKIIKKLGEYINKHFAEVGGFSTRTAANLFLTVLPYSDLAETEQIVNDFRQDLQSKGLLEIGDQDNLKTGSCSGFSISAGLAEGRTDHDIESVIALAESKRKPFARFVCETGSFR